MSLLARILPRPVPRPLDLADPAVARDPFPHYEALRRTGGPVQPLGEEGTWIVLGHDEVKSALEQPHLFSSAPYGEIDPVLLAADPPRHMPVRRLVSRHFSSDALVRLTEVATARAEAAIAPEMEVVEDYAVAVSRAVAAALIGFGEADRTEIAAAAASMSSSPDPLAFFIAELDRLAPRAGVYAKLREQSRGELGDAELRSLVRLLWLAATTTTERVIAHSVLQMLRNPELRTALTGEAKLIETFIEEVMRLNPPEHMLPRRAIGPARLGGALIPAGAHVWLCVAGANRDPAKFESPDRLRLDRPTRRHFAFGSGIHQCVGAPLSRRVVAAALEVLLRRAGDLRPLEPLDSLEYYCSLTALAPARLRIGT
jgi:cytochrome P450